MSWGEEFSQSQKILLTVLDAGGVLVAHSTWKFTTVLDTQLSIFIDHFLARVAASLTLTANRYAKILVQN